MPAILLARPNHRKGGLHIKVGTPADFEPQNRPTQAGKMHDTFTGLFYQDKAAPLKTAKKKKQFADTVGENTKEVQEKLYAAIQGTYHSMYSYMFPQLKNALPKLEISYYRQIAEKKHKKADGTLLDGYDMDSSHIDSVYKAAEKNNNKVMQAHGWIEP